MRILYFLFAFLFLILPFRARAAEFSIAAPRATPPQAVFSAEARVSTLKSLNAFEGELVYPTRLLAVDALQDAGSVVTVWLEYPVADNGRIRFSGITPGGYAGTGGLLFTVKFRAIKEGSGELSVQLPRAYINNVAAEPAEVTAIPARFEISVETEDADGPPLHDTTPPQPFALYLARNAMLYDGKAVLLFSTQDKESSVAYFEICEGLLRPTCEKGQSPFVLKNQKTNGLIRVRAVDTRGNVRIARLSTFAATIYYVGLSIIGILVIVGACFFYFRRKSVIHSS